MTPRTGLRYVYAVCHPFEAALQCQLCGVGGAPPALLRHRDLVAVISIVPEEDFSEARLRAHLADLDWRTRTARAHERVIDALATVTTPLPLRLATVLRDDSAVRTMLEARESDFLRILERLHGRVEWGVQIYLEPRESAGPPVSREDDAERVARDVHGSLARHADDFRLYAPHSPALPGAPGRNVLNASYLVSRTDSEEFVELVDRTKGERTGMRVELAGPRAPYSFTGESA
ncbi:GvpL/GvpF family gas vesicle protein [Streptomyces sp. NPDC002676]